MQTSAPIVLFCDFGLPYTGQMKGRIAAELAHETPCPLIIDLFHDVPAFDVEAGSRLLAAHADDFPKGSVFLCVVDPGVGTDQRKPGAVLAGGRWFVGPLNGIFEHVMRKWDAQAFEIAWRPATLSSSFHGRDLFAPIAARLLAAQLVGEAGQGKIIPELTPIDANPLRKPEYPDNIERVIYVDQFGNMMTGIAFDDLDDSETVAINTVPLVRARTFGEVEQGCLFVYRNAVGLLEIAANGGDAQKIVYETGGADIKIVKV